MKKFVCELCGYAYDVKEGDPENNIEPGTEFDDIDFSESIKDLFERQLRAK